MKLKANIFDISTTKKGQYPGDTEGDSLIVTGGGSAQKGETAQQYGQAGFISNPPKSKGIRLRIGSIDIIIAAYNYKVALPEHQGETKVYSTDADGNETGNLSLKQNGKFGYKNLDQSEDLKTVLSDLIDAVKNIITTGSPTTHTVSTASKTALTTINTRLEKVMEAL